MPSSALMKAVFLILLGALLGVAVLPYILFRQSEMPAGTNLASPDFSFNTAELLIDRTVFDTASRRHLLQHQIFDKILEEIAAAETFLIIDFFLWNSWTGAIEAPEGLRPLSKELSDALIAKRIQNPDMPMLVITDPLNRIYGDLHPDYFDTLAAAQIPVVFTDLDRLPDSNMVYAPQAQFWKKFFGEEVESSSTRWIPNPLQAKGEKLTTAQLLRLLYFKANHRKTVVSGQHSGAHRLLLSSLNPADGSANHSNLGLLVDGGVANFAAESELAIAKWSAENPSNVHGALSSQADDAIRRIESQLSAIPATAEARAGEASAAYRSEEAVRTEIIRQLQEAGSGARIDIGMFYFSDRKVVEALKAAIERGAIARILLDANRDAFGRAKNGIPNRIVASELMELADAHQVQVRWAASNGEQFHGKFLRISGAQQQILFLGSANWTRRNLANLNLESNLLLSNSTSINREFDAYFDAIWNNTQGYEESLPFEAWTESGWTLRLKTWLYRFQEWSGASTF